jgi:hypothetical protein
MGVTEDLADALARDVLEAVEKTGDDTLIDAIAKTLGTSSSVTQDAFMTSIRVRTAEARARKLLTERLRKAMADRKAGTTQ